MIRRLTALIALAASLIGQASLCAGWALTAAERMACCESEAMCPMHATPGVASHHARPTQPEADACCAASPKGSASIEKSSVLSMPATVMVPVRLAPVLVASPHPDDRPRPPSRARHVLLSVFLV